MSGSASWMMRADAGQRLAAPVAELRDPRVDQFGRRGRRGSCGRRPVRCSMSWSLHRLLTCRSRRAVRWPASPRRRTGLVERVVLADVEVAHSGCLDAPGGSGSSDVPRKKATFTYLREAVEAEEPALALDAVERRVPLHRLAHAGHGRARSARRAGGRRPASSPAWRRYRPAGRRPWRSYCRLTELGVFAHPSDPRRRRSAHSRPGSRSAIFGRGV